MTPRSYTITGAQLRELLDPKQMDKESTDPLMNHLRRELMGRTRVVGQFTIVVNERTE